MYLQHPYPSTLPILTLTTDSLTSTADLSQSFFSNTLHRPFDPGACNFHPNQNISLPTCPHSQCLRNTNLALENLYPYVLSLHGLKLNGTHQLLAYADDVNILEGSVHTVKKNAEALVAATKEIELEVNAHKTKYMTVSRDQNAGRIHSMKMDNSFIERVDEFKYLGTTLTNQNSIQEEIKCR